MEFNKEKHAQDLFESELIIADAQILLKKMKDINDYISEEEFVKFANSVFGTLSVSLNRALKLVTESEETFTSIHSVSYLSGCEEAGEIV
jgi:hypothetical protein